MSDKSPTLPQSFAELMKTGWAQPDEDHLTPIEQIEHTAERRRQLSIQFPSETLVIPTGSPRTRSSDTDYEFRPGSDFAYLTGCYEEDAVLVMNPTDEGHDATLYLRGRTPRTQDDYYTRGHGELWVGRRHTLKGYQTIFGLECAELDDLDAVLETLHPAKTRVRRGISPSIDASIPKKSSGNSEQDVESLDPEAQLSESSNASNTAEVLDRDAELAAALAEMRMVKDDWEITQLQDAVDVTTRGFTDIARALGGESSTPERLLDGVFSLRARHDGNSVGYGNIVAAGEHACTLHWWRNNGMARSGELLLVDAGVENVHYYTADITRTLPVSGTFTPAQRRVYDIVYASQEAGFAAVKPGATWKEVHTTCMRVLAEGLGELGILPVTVEEALHKDSHVYRRWTLHTFGHLLGIDVHDCNDARNAEYRDGSLEPGMVLTVEPGLYFQPDDLLVPEEYRGIGIRIEDDVLVTDAGCKVLSAALPRQADEVEAWLAEQHKQPYELPR